MCGTAFTSRFLRKKTMSRDTEELEKIRLALAEVRKSQERMDETSKSLRDVSDLLEAMLKTGPVDVTGVDSYNNTNRYVYEDTLVTFDPVTRIPRITPLDTDNPLI